MTEGIKAEKLIKQVIYQCPWWRMFPAGEGILQFPQ